MERNKPKDWDIIMLDINYMSKDYKKEYNILKNVTEGGSKKNASLIINFHIAIFTANPNLLCSFIKIKTDFFLSLLGFL